MKRVNFHLTSQQMATLERIRADTGIKVAELIRRAVDEYIQNSGDKRDFLKKKPPAEELYANTRISE